MQKQTKFRHRVTHTPPKFFRTFHIEISQIRWIMLTKSALLSPAFSPWNQLLNHGDDNSFLTLTGFTRAAFMQLENILFVEVLITAKRGRPPALNRRGQIGLYMFFASSRMNLKHLCMIFGIVPTTASDYITKMLKLVVKRLKRNPISRVKFPTEEEMIYFAGLVNNREPRINNVIGFVDGVSIPSLIQTSLWAFCLHYITWSGSVA
jgi:hypothetical protein